MLSGGSGVNWIAGGQGDDTIAASGTQNYIFGDSSFTVGKIIPAFMGTGNTIDLSSRLLTIDNSGTTGGANTITVTGGGSSTVLGHYGTTNMSTDIDGDAVTPKGHRGSVRDSWASSSEVITKIASVNTSLGGDDLITVGNGDIIIGGYGDNQIIVGNFGADVIVGANGEIDYTYNNQTLTNVLTSIESIDPSHSGNDIIAGPKDINGNYTPAGSGNSIVIGGTGADTIDVGGSNNKIIGNDGKASFDPTTGKLTSITTQDPTRGGNASITVSGGSQCGSRR